MPDKVAAAENTEAENTKKDGLQIKDYIEYGKSAFGYLSSPSEGEQNAKQMLETLQKYLEACENEEKKLHSDLEKIENTQITEENRINTAERMAKVSKDISAAKELIEECMSQLNTIKDKDQDSGLAKSTFTKLKDWTKGVIGLDNKGKEKIDSTDPIKNRFNFVMTKLNGYEVKLLKVMVKLGRPLKDLPITVDKIEKNLREIEEKNSPEKTKSGKRKLKDKITKTSSLITSCKNKLDVVEILCSTLTNHKQDKTRELRQTLYAALKVGDEDGSKPQLDHADLMKKAEQLKEKIERFRSNLEHIEEVLDDINSEETSVKGFEVKPGEGTSERKTTENDAGKTDTSKKLPASASFSNENGISASDRFVAEKMKRETGIRKPAEMAERPTSQNEVDNLLPVLLMTKINRIKLSKIKQESEELRTSSQQFSGQNINSIMAKIESISQSLAEEDEHLFTVSSVLELIKSSAVDKLSTDRARLSLMFLFRRLNGASESMDGKPLQNIEATDLIANITKSLERYINELNSCKDSILIAETNVLSCMKEIRKDIEKIRSKSFELITNPRQAAKSTSILAEVKLTTALAENVNIGLTFAERIVKKLHEKGRDEDFMRKSRPLFRALTEMIMDRIEAVYRTQDPVVNLSSISVIENDIRDLKTEINVISGQLKAITSSDVLLVKGNTPSCVCCIS